MCVSDIRTETAIPQTAETAKIARRNESATVVWFTRGIAARKSTVIPATINNSSRLLIVRRRTKRVICQFYRIHQWRRERAPSEQKAGRLAGSCFAVAENERRFQAFFGLRTRRR